MKTLLDQQSENETVTDIPYCPEGTRVYCVGDIHGRLDLLKQLHLAILHDAAGYSGTKTLIYIGDYIDRGLASKGVIDNLLVDPLPDFELVYLRGNHEQFLLDFLDEVELGWSWLIYGGLATLLSYEVPLRKIPSSKQEMVALHTELKKRMPEAHFDFMAGTQIFYELGSYYFVHAGIRPDKALRDQVPADQLWIREAYTQSTQTYEKIIVHGHTITPEPELLPNRIGIDTGAYATNHLTCLILEGQDQRFIQTHPANL